nr:mitotic spindle assembly checkpoint protein MAD2B [Vanessa tameamea]
MSVICFVLLVIMDSCLVDITIEFLAVAFHSILYYTSTYPESIFETKKKYNIVVYRSMHPELNQYIDLCLKSIAECLKTGQLKRLEFAITDNTYKPILKFIFDFDHMDVYDETADAYLIKTEQNLRAFCLKLATLSNKFTNLPQDGSFTIYIHTNESTAVAMASKPDLEDFPLVEMDDKYEDSDKILPIRRFSVRNCCIDTYIEFAK